MNFTVFDRALEQCCHWVWQTSWHATVLIAIVMLAQSCLGKVMTPRWRYLLGLLVLVRLLLPAVPQSSISIFNLEHRLVKQSEPRGFIPAAASPAKPLAEIPAAIPAPAGHISATGLIKYFWLAGCLLMLASVFRRQRKLTREIAAQSPVTDPPRLRLLDDCRSLLGIRRRIQLVATPHLDTPALFGHFRPRLLIPAKMWQTLTEPELRLIVLHELTHLQRGDILLNWLMIVLRALHWFNPAVWFAFKRLRADQEIACDAAVMARLTAGERQLYGSTLIKLAEAASGFRLCPSLVPFITRNHIIKRRITMISKFKPTTRLALTGSLALIIALGGLTLTRAKDGPPVEPAKPIPGASAEPPGGRIQALKKELDSLNDQIRYREEELNRLRRSLNIPSDVVEGKSQSKVDSESIHHIRAVLIDSEAQYTRDEKLLSQLKMMSAEVLRQALPTAAPDALLTQLMGDQIAAESKLRVLMLNFGDEHPDVKRARVVSEDLNKKVEDRIKGILMGLQTKVASLKALVDDLKDKLKKSEAENTESAEEWQPFFKVQDELKRQKRFHDVLALRLQQEETGVAMPPAGSNPAP